MLQFYVNVLITALELSILLVCFYLFLAMAALLLPYHHSEENTHLLNLTNISFHLSWLASPSVQGLSQLLWTAFR